MNINTHTHKDHLFLYMDFSVLFRFLAFCFDFLSNYIFFLLTNDHCEVFYLNVFVTVHINHTFATYILM